MPWCQTRKQNLGPSVRSAFQWAHGWFKTMANSGKHCCSITILKHSLLLKLLINIHYVQKYAFVILFLTRSRARTDFIFFNHIIIRKILAAINTNKHAHAWIYSHTPSYTHTRLHIHAHACIYTHMPAYTHTCLHIHAYACIYTHTPDDSKE